MDHTKPLPQYLLQRYHGWRATKFEENKAWYARLVDEGQRPRAMVISCCDSRLHVTSVFGAETGEMFIHRNIANLIPPYAPNKDYHGTSAAIEYAVTALHVSNIIVMGHSSCGGIQGCYDMCSGAAPALEEDTSFIGRWMDILRPGYERVKDLELERSEKLTKLEHQGVLVSLENLMTFPFVKDAVESGELSLHGLWMNIREGEVRQYDPARDEFLPL